MSMKKWQTLAEKKAAVERQNDKILTAMKNKAIEKEFGQLSGEEVFKPLTRRLDRAFTKQIKTDAEEGPNYNMDDFDLYNPFGEDFRPDVETPPPTPPPSPEVPDYSMVESDQDFEEETPTSSPPLTSSPAPPLAEKEDDDDDDDDDDAEGDDVAEGGDDGATPSHDLSQSVERAKWGTPQKPGIEGSESTDLQVLNSMLTKNVNNPDYVVKSPKSKFYGYTLSDIKKARDEILERRGEKKAKSSLFFEKEPPDQEGSGVVDVNDLVDRLYISIGSIKAVYKMKHLNLLLNSAIAKKSDARNEPHNFQIHFDPPIDLDPAKRYKAALNELVTMSYSWFSVSEKYDNNKFKWKKKSDSDWVTVTIPEGMYDYKDLNDAFQSHTGKTDDSKDIFKLYFHTTTYRVIILIANDYELDLSEGNLSELIGFNKKILNDMNNVGDRVPNLTRGVDWIYIHCDLISRSVDNIADDVLYTLSTSTLEISYPFSKEPRRLLWHPVNKYRINSIKIRISDGQGNDIFLNDQPVALSIVIEEEE
ncbi:hypothetical protein ACROYT_G042077 [Oculina patagonica]